MKKLLYITITCTIFLVAILGCKKSELNKTEPNFKPINRKTISYDYFLGTWYLLSYDFGLHIDTSRYLIISRKENNFTIEYIDEQGVIRYGTVYESENSGDKELSGSMEPFGKMKICITNSIDKNEDGAISIILYDTPEPVDIGTFQKNIPSVGNTNTTNDK